MTHAGLGETPATPLQGPLHVCCKPDLLDRQTQMKGAGVAFCLGRPAVVPGVPDFHS